MIRHTDKKRVLLHLAGAAVVLFWLALMALLVRDVHFGAPGSSTLGEGPEGKPLIASSQREWKEIFLKDKKVGYAVSLIEPYQAGYFIQEEIFLRLNLMGLGNSLHSVTQCRVDEGFLLRSFHFALSSGVVRFHVTGRVEDEQMLVETGRGKDRKTQALKLVKRPMVGAGLTYYLRTRELRVGEVFRLPVFDPSTMAQKEMLLRVSSREPVTISRIPYDAFRLEAEMWGKKISTWVGTDGTVLKEEGFMGLTAVKSSAARAPEDLDPSGGTDLYELTSVKPDRALPDPGRLAGLRLEIAGLEGSEIPQEVLNGGRQSYREKILEVRREKIPAQAGYLLPYPDTAGRMTPFLSPEMNIQSDDEEMRKKAREICGNDREPTTAARKLLDWVFRNVEKRPVLSVPSALEVLRTRVGDCNEHATLLVALLRAAGIPARLCIGLAYSRDRFYYHAWAEAYLGDWVTLDATLNQMPADPGHVKLIEGNLEKQVVIAGLVGEISMKVLDFQYD
jgi:hypothetical protein